MAGGGPPCEIWCALRGKQIGCPRALRSRSMLLGLPHIGSRERSQVQLGNVLWRAGFSVVAAYGAMGVPAFLEHPCQNADVERPS
eukprot:11544896-Karenia_brevis.AAC.1